MNEIEEMTEYLTALHPELSLEDLKDLYPFIDTGEKEDPDEQVKPHRSRQGAENERALLNYLEQKYPGVQFNWLSDNGKTTFDIDCKYCLFDMVGVDKSLRLITDHKKRMKEHIKEAKERNISGYIAFKFKDTFYFLNVASSYFKKWKRVPITFQLLAACVQPPIPIEEPLKRKIEPIPELLQPKKTIHLRWSEIPGADNEIHLNHLVERGFDWVKTAKIEKTVHSPVNESIKISTGTHYLLFNLNKITKKVIMQTDKGEIEEFKYISRH